MEITRLNIPPVAGFDPLRGEIVTCLEAGLQFLRGETSLAAQKLARRVLANIIIEHLELCGYVIHRAADAPPL